MHRLYATLLLLVTACSPLAHAQPAAQTLPLVTIRGVAPNHSSARLHLAPVAGAVDYRVYDVANPLVVKYAGTRHYTTEGTFGFRPDPATGQPRWPLEVASNTPAGGSPNLPIVLDLPIPELEWNELGDGLPHTLIVEAVDALGPVSDANTYDFQTLEPTLPGTMMYGMNKGPTADGRVTLNGQGDRLNNPQVLARSAPFVVQVDSTIRALPSGPDADSVFYDTFDAHEAHSLHQTQQSPGPPAQDPPGGATKRYVLNDGDPTKGWTIHYQAADLMRAVPFIGSSHFMDVLVNQFAGASWSTMAMQPQRAWDLTGGSILHATFEADSAMDLSGRRWLGVDFAPAADPFVSFNTGNLAVAPLNKSQQGLFWELFANNSRTGGYFTGPSANPAIPQAVNLDACRSEPRINYQYNGRGWDNRSRFDVFLTTTRLLVVEDGVLLTNCALPVALPWTQTAVYFAHYYYHADADLAEEPTWGPWNRYLLDRFPVTEERHWDNMGVERLPATAETNWDNPVSLLARSQPHRPAVEQCPADWTCQGVGRYAPRYPGGVEQRGPTTYAVHSAGAPVDDADMLYGLWQPATGDTALTATLTDHANLSYWSTHGQAGVMIRESLDPRSPLYALVHHQDGTLHVVTRASGGALQTVAQSDTVRLPVQLRVSSQGTTLKAEYMTDGATWQGLGPAQVRDWPLGWQGVVDWELQYSGAGFVPQIGTAVFDLDQTAKPPRRPTSTSTPPPLSTATASSTATVPPTAVPTATIAPSPTTGATLAPSATPTAVPTAVPLPATPTRGPTPGCLARLPSNNPRVTLCVEMVP